VIWKYYALLQEEMGFFVCQRVYKFYSVCHLIIFHIVERLCSDLIAKNRDINGLLYFTERGSKSGDVATFIPNEGTHVTCSFYQLLVLL